MLCDKANANSQYTKKSLTRILNLIYFSGWSKPIQEPHEIHFRLPKVNRVDPGGENVVVRYLPQFHS